MASGSPSSAAQTRPTSAAVSASIANRLRSSAGPPGEELGRRGSVERLQDVEPFLVETERDLTGRQHAPRTAPGRAARARGPPRPPPGARSCRAPAGWSHRTAAPAVRRPRPARAAPRPPPGRGQPTRRRRPAAPARRRPGTTSRAPPRPPAWSCRPRPSRSPSPAVNRGAAPTRPPGPRRGRRAARRRRAGCPEVRPTAGGSPGSRPGRAPGPRGTAGPRRARRRGRRRRSVRTRAYAASASAWRPDRYSASTSETQNPSRQRVLGHQRLEVADELASAAELDASGQRVLEQPEPDLLEPGAVRDGPVGGAGQHLAAEQGQRLGRVGQRPCRVPRRPRRRRAARPARRRG